MTKWNEIPFDENASPETKAHEFDLQVAENAAAQPQQTAEELREQYEAEENEGR